MRYFIIFIFSFYVSNAIANELSLEVKENETKERCLTVHGIHSAKSIGLADPDWEVPKEHICGLNKIK